MSILHCGNDQFNRVSPPKEKKIVNSLHLLNFSFTFTFQIMPMNIQYEWEVYTEDEFNLDRERIIGQLLYFDV